MKLVARPVSERIRKNQLVACRRENVTTEVPSLTVGVRSEVLSANRNLKTEPRLSRRGHANDLAATGHLAITLEGVHIAQVLPVLPAPRSAVVQNERWTFSLSVIVNTNTLVIRKWPLMRIHPTDYSTSRRLARDFLLRYLPFMQAPAGMVVSDRDNSVNLFEIGNPKIMEGRMQVQVGRIS